MHKFVKKVAKELGLNPHMLKEIIRLKVRFHKDVEVADKLGISRGTVAKHVEAIKQLDEAKFKKLIKTIWGDEMYVGG